MGESNFPNPHDKDIAALESGLAANVLALSKVSDGMTYVVNGDQSIEAVSIPAGAYVRLVNSAITGRSDGIYTAKKAIPVAPTVLDSTYFNESAPIAGGVANALNSKIVNIYDSGFRTNTTGYQTIANANEYTFVTVLCQISNTSPHNRIVNGYTCPLSVLKAGALVEVVLVGESGTVHVKSDTNGNVTAYIDTKSSWGYRVIFHN